MNREELIEELKKLEINISANQLELLDKYYNFLKEYNSHTNITAIVEKQEVYLKHFYDSLTIVKAVKLDKQKIIDIGSGAGFPGIVLKIIFPNIKLTVLDSNNKKTNFLTKLTDILQIKDINIINERAEDYSKKHQKEYDICLSRAVAFIDIIVSLSIPFIKEDGIIILMKGNIINEVKILKKHYLKMGVLSWEIINFNLPKCQDERNLVVIKRQKNISQINYNQILKRHKLWQSDNTNL